MQKVIVFTEKLDENIEATLNEQLNDGWRIVNMISQPVAVCSSCTYQWKYGGVMVVMEKIEVVTVDSPSENVLKTMVEKWFDRISKERKNG